MPRAYKEGITIDDSALRDAMKYLEGGATKAVAKSLYMEAEGIMTVSKEVYVPVDTSNLRQSGTVLPPEIKGDTVSVEMGYGGLADDYALIQHENLEFFHPNGGSAKYLEIPFKAALGGMGNRIANDIKKWVAKAKRK